MGSHDSANVRSANEDWTMEWFVVFVDLLADNNATKVKSIILVGYLVCAMLLNRLARRRLLLIGYENNLTESYKHAVVARN